METWVTLLQTNTHTQNTMVPGFMSGRGSEGTSGNSICSCKKQRKGVSGVCTATGCRLQGLALSLCPLPIYSIFR